MFVINEDKSIYITRGDVAFFSLLVKTEDGETYKFSAGDVIRFKVYEKKACENVVLSKDFGIEAETEEIEIYLSEKDTKIGDVISKPTDYWYEVELNPYTNPQTILGYDDDGAKIFKLFPEGNEKEDDEPITPEDIPVVDEELDLTSTRPVQNQAIARAVANIKTEVRNELTKYSAEIEKSIGGKIDEEISNRIGESLDVKISEEVNAKLDEEVSTKVDAEISKNFGDYLLTDISDDFVLSINEEFFQGKAASVHKQGNVISGNVSLISYIAEGATGTVEGEMFTVNNAYLPKGRLHILINGGIVTYELEDTDKVINHNVILLMSQSDGEVSLETPVTINHGFSVNTSFTYICE